MNYVQVAHYADDLCEIREVRGFILSDTEGQGEYASVLSCIFSFATWKAASALDFNPSAAKQSSYAQLSRRLDPSCSRPSPNTGEFSLENNRGTDHCAG